MDRVGYYVEGKYFGGRAAQANALAQNRANEYGRPVTVQVKDFSGEVRETATYQPNKQVA